MYEVKISQRLKLITSSPTTAPYTGLVSLREVGVSFRRNGAYRCGVETVPKSAGPGWEGPKAPA